MFRNYHVMILKDDQEVDKLTKLAANHHLHCLYKIGVYGKERQHELFVIGKTKDYREFEKEVESKVE